MYPLILFALLQFTLGQFDWNSAFKSHFEVGQLKSDLIITLEYKSEKKGITDYDVNISAIEYDNFYVYPFNFRISMTQRNNSFIEYHDSGYDISMNAKNKTINIISYPKMVVESNDIIYIDSIEMKLSYDYFSSKNLFTPYINSYDSKICYVGELLTMIITNDISKYDLSKYHICV